MALTETRPETEASETSDVDTAPVSSTDFLSSGDHKTTGRLWIGSGALMAVIALGISLAAGVEHIDQGSLSLVDQQGQFTQLWSMGRLLLLFGGIVPILVGVATFIVPLQIGASSLAFARGAQAAFWTWFVATDLFIIAYILNGGPAGGAADATVLWALSFAGMLLALTWAMICIATTILDGRTTGMALDDVPVSNWGFFVFALVGIMSLPILVAQLVLAYLDVRYGFLADRASRGSLVSVGNTALLAPSVFWVGIPALGVAFETIAVHSGRPLRFSRSIMAALGLLGVLSFGADLVGFASQGRTLDFSNGLLVAGLLVIPLPILSALGMGGDSLKNGRPQLRAPLLAGLLAGLLVLLGALVAVLGTVWPIVGFIETNFDTSVNLTSSFDLGFTSFHEGIRGLLMGAGVLATIAAVQHWGHKIWGRALDDRIGMLATLITALGAVVWAVGGVVSGFMGQAMLPEVGDVDSGVDAMNAVTAGGVGLMALGALLLLLNTVRVAMGSGPSNEPWSGTTLEWTTSCPPPAGNFETPPVFDGDASIELASTEGASV